MWTAKHTTAGKSKINQVVVYHLDAAEIYRLAVEPKFDTLTGGKATFAFLASSLRPGVVGACHCALGWVVGGVRAASGELRPVMGSPAG